MAVGVELCRLTVRSPQRQCDLALPASATVGELIPLLLRLTMAEKPGDPAAAGAPEQWALRRLGGPAFDAGATAEQLDLREGEILYFDLVEAAAPEPVFDDLGVGVAQEVRGRADFWRPAFTRVALLAAACAALAGYAADVWGLRPAADRPAWFYLAAALLTCGAVAASRIARDREAAIVCALAACAFGAAAGLAARSGTSAAPDHRTLVLAAGGVAVPGAVAACFARLPVTLFGAVTGTAVCALIGGLAVAELHWSPVQAAAALAVLLFGATTYAARTALRAARLRVSQLPRTAEELQEDIAPESFAAVRLGAAAVVGYLNSVFISFAAVWSAAVFLLARTPGWPFRTLAAVLSVAVLLRAHSAAMAWQRGPLLACAAAGIVLTAVEWPSQIGQGPRVLVLIVFALAAAALLVAARRLPGRRLLPLWAQLADQLELATAVALVPTLLQIFHTYAYFRALVG